MIRRRTTWGSYVLCILNVYSKAFMKLDLEILGKHDQSVAGDDFFAVRGVLR